MNKIRYLIVTIIGLLFVSGSVFCNSKSVSAATIQDMKNKFPNGAYWNHVVKNGHGYSHYQDQGSCNNPNGFTWTPCDTHNGNVGVGGHDCNSFQNAMQCCGFVKKLAYDLYGSTHPSWGTTTLANAKVGDVMHYWGGGADATNGHWVMIIGKNGNTLTFGECNVGSNCKISWGRTFNISRASRYVIFSAPWAASLGPDTPVTFTDFNQNGVWETNAEMYIKILNPQRTTISAVGCYLYDSSGKLVKSYSESHNFQTSYVNYNCNINNDMKYTLKPGTTYKFELYTVSNGKEYKDTMRSFTTKGKSDTEKPVITDVQVEDVNESGYTVRCKASDNMGVDRVQFPTWTVQGGQDDLAKDWWENKAVRGEKDASGYYVYKVKISDHNNEYGEYITHIYAFDQAGNSVFIAVPRVTVKKGGSSGGEDIDHTADANSLVSVAQKEYDTYHGQEYNAQYGSSPWCCNFVSWCARQAGISSDVIRSTATVQTMYDSLLNECGAMVVTSPQKGDLVFYKYTDYDSTKFHHIGIMISSTETIQGNVDNTWWKGKPDALKNIKEMVYVRPAYDGKYVEPSTAYFSDYNLNKIEENNAEVYVKIQNPNRERVTAVGCELYDESGQLLKEYSEEHSFTTSYVNYTCNFNTDMGYTLSPGTKYNFVLYAVVGGKRISDSMRTFTTKDGNFTSSLQLKDDSFLTLTEKGFLTGLNQKKNMVSEIREQFAADDIVIRNISGKELGAEELVGTGSTVYVMDGDTVKASCPVVLAGDVNGDGKVIGKDVSLLARSVVNKVTLSDVQKAAGDVLADGKIIGKDVSLLARSLVGKSSISSQG